MNDDCIYAHTIITILNRDCSHIACDYAIVNCWSIRQSHPL